MRFKVEAESVNNIQQRNYTRQVCMFVFMLQLLLADRNYPFNNSTTLRDQIIEKQVSIFIHC